ncbi:gamma-glutamylcyclotransferase family protein [Salinarimonas sp. NSM]|uniref:gamma-glutamylcyclotransferase family protein n=1 Tax=Salinarimonas sp. NSM TaxID=3458003 RepID=UPI004036329F
MPLYFAYGSNMDRTQMAARCPASRPIGTARLMRHRVVIMREGWASVARAPHGAVWGVLWDLALRDVPALDRWESLHTGLYTKLVQPVLTEKGARRAIVYVGRASEGGTPQPGYLESVVAAAEAAGLPPSWLATLRALHPDAAQRRHS